MRTCKKSCGTCPECYDEYKECAAWAVEGLCEKNSKKNVINICRMSCGVCAVKRPTPRNNSLLALGTEDWTVNSRQTSMSSIKARVYEPPAPASSSEDQTQAHTEAYGPPAPTSVEAAPSPS